MECGQPPGNGGQVPRAQPQGPIDILRAFPPVRALFRLKPLADDFLLCKLRLPKRVMALNLSSKHDLAPKMVDCESPTWFFSSNQVQSWVSVVTFGSLLLVPLFLLCMLPVWPVTPRNFQPT